MSSSISINVNGFGLAISDVRKGVSDDLERTLTEEIARFCLQGRLRKW